MSLTNVKTMEITAKIPDGFNLAQETAYYEKHIHNSKTYYLLLSLYILRLRKRYFRYPYRYQWLLK